MARVIEDFRQLGGDAGATPLEPGGVVNTAYSVLPTPGSLAYCRYRIPRRSIPACGTVAALPRREHRETVATLLQASLARSLAPHHRGFLPPGPPSRRQPRHISPRTCSLGALGQISWVKVSRVHLPVRGLGARRWRHSLFTPRSAGNLPGNLLDEESRACIEASRASGPGCSIV